MLRLFSMFPTGAPGVALLVLRASIAAALLYEMPFCARLGNPAIYWLVPVLSVLLCLGFLTPIASAGACAFELITILISQQSNPAFAVLAGLNSVVTAMVGPGAYSVDAKLFGRREITFQPRKGLDR